MKTKLAPAFRTLIAATLLVCAVDKTAHAQSLPTPWSSSDIGAPALSGSATHSNGVFTVNAAGTDIWYSSDQFHFVYQPFSGDGEIIARVASLANSDMWAKAGVMIRESLTSQSRHATVVVTPGAGYSFQRRPLTGGSSVDTSGGTGAAPGWLRLVRSGDQFTAYRSTNGTTWTLIASDTITMGATVYAGLAVTSHNGGARTTAAIDSVRVTSQSSGNAPPAVSVTQPATNTHYPAPASMTIGASATDPENRMASVGFYVNNSLIGTDTTSPYSAAWSTSTPGTYTIAAMAQDADGGSSWSSSVTVIVDAANRAPTVSLTSPAAGATFTAPATVNLAASASDTDGSIARVEFFSGTTRLATDTTAPYSYTWSSVASGTYSVTAVAYDNAGASTTSAAVTVTVSSGTTSTPTLQGADIGSPTPAGSTTVSSGTYTVRAGGRDIWYASDQFHFANAQASGNVEVTARVSSLTNSDMWAKAGVMIRASLSADAANAMVATTPSAGHTFQRRTTTAANSVNTATTGTPPAWVRLVRTGNVFDAFTSTDGVSWTKIGSDTIVMGATVYVGLAVTSHNTTTATTATISNVTIRPLSTSNQPPTVSLTSPANNATFTAPATISIAANASDPENQLSRVEFFNGTTLLGSDTSSPYAFSWTNVAAGTYNLTAVAYDAAGANATSTAVRVTVNGANAAPSVSLTSPASGATFTAPATVTLSATASDPENQLARVEFFSGTTRLATVTASPYTYTWSNVAAGSYSITAVAYDTAGASATSAARTITVTTTTSTAPTAVSFAASTDHSTNVNSYVLKVFASGANPATATPVATSDLGKPTPDGSNTITVDRASFFSALAAGNYVATVTAIGPGGQTQSSSVTFTR